MHELEALVAAVRAEFAPDHRMAVFEVDVEQEGTTISLFGRTTEERAVAALVARLNALSDVDDVVDRVDRLPEAALGAGASAVVRASVAPVYPEPRLAAGQVTQYVMGHRLDLLQSQDAWLRTRGEDGYIGWVHGGYVEVGDLEWARAWERGDVGEPFVSLGAELEDGAGNVFARLPWGARVVADTPSRFRLPDGRRGTLGSGEIVAADRLADRFPPRGESLSRTARRWLGVPYLWGGVTPAGTDCSGFVQSVFWMHGLALPRDSDQQARVGAEVSPGTGFADLRPGDLVFFSEESPRITHVALSLGGPHVVHAGTANGGVDVNDLNGELELERRLRRQLVVCRRIVPDS